MNAPSAPGPCAVCSRPMGRAVRCPWCGEPAPAGQRTRLGLLLCALATTLALLAALLGKPASPFVPGQIQSIIPWTSASLPTSLRFLKPHLPWMAMLAVLFLAVRIYPGPHWLQNDLRRRTHLRDTVLGLCIATAFGALGLAGGRLANLQPPPGSWNPFPLAIFLGTLLLNFHPRGKKPAPFQRMPAWGMLLLAALLGMNIAGVVYLGAGSAAFSASQKLETDPRLPLMVILWPLALNAPGLVFPG